ncbi:MAG TPA: carbohydrate ABC transporter permease [Chloroflexi bacterium]|nr:carbohydrate ABC transporter permease [Chloroflexota bacterium]HBY06818.1 carbohydrate ABC transporter permease [Chloroflexota bacterium]
MISTYKLGTWISRFFVYLLLVILLLIVIVPVWLLLVNGTRSTAEINQGLALLPSTHMAENYNLLLAKGLNLPQGLRNSLFLAASSTFISVYFAFVTAYGLVVYSFRGRKQISNFIVVLTMIPMQLTILGFYKFMANLGWTDTYYPLLIPLIANAGGTFFARQYLEAMVLHDLIDAARIDGAGELRIFHSVMMPLAVPGMITLGIFSFVGSWNNFFTPFIILSTRSKFTLPMLVQLMRGDAYRTEYGAIYLGLGLSLIPIILVYIFASRYIISGIAMGAIKE